MRHMLTVPLCALVLGLNARLNSGEEQELRRLGKPNGECLPDHTVGEAAAAPQEDLADWLFAYASTKGALHA